ncbi:cytochrome P450 [Mycena vulgaris]|nr:cytochrome P450 [Mycena vulgaris]
MAFGSSEYAALAVGLYTVWSILRRIFGATVLDNIPGPPSHSIWTGNLPEFYDPDGWEFHHDIEENYGQVVKIKGFLGTPHLYIFDPAALQSMLVQDVDAYEENLIYMRVYGLLWGPGILSSVGQDHHKYRKIMMPAFAPSRIREMIPMFYDVAEKACDGLISPFLADGPRQLDLNNILSRTSLEVIGRAGIGYSFDAMLPGQEREDKYAETLKELLPTVFQMSLLFPLLPWLSRRGSPAFRRSVVNIIPSKTLHKARDLVDLMEITATKLIAGKKEAVKSGELEMQDDSKDIMSLLLKGNLNADEGMYLNDDELVAQTGSNDNIRGDRYNIKGLRAEILESSERMDYEELGSLPYLDAFINEVLRLYPPVAPVMFRETVQETILPLSTPIIGVDGSEIRSIPIPKGTSVYVAIAAANHNKQIWGADALEFKPERWQNGKAGAKTERICGIYGNMMTFLGGGRSCIGFQFSLLEIKVVLSVFLRSVRFSPAEADVKWKMPGIISVPSVDGKVQLPTISGEGSIVSLTPISLLCSPNM